MSSHNSNQVSSDATGNTNNNNNGQPTTTTAAAAPYPPMMRYFVGDSYEGPTPSSAQVSNLKSSLATSPHYTTSTLAFPHHHQNRPVSSDGVTTTTTALGSPQDHSVLYAGRPKSHGSEFPSSKQQQQQQQHGQSSLQTATSRGDLSPHASQIKLCTWWKDATTLACINCAPTSTGSNISEPLATTKAGGGGKTRKLGPILLDLRRLQPLENSSPVLCTKTIGYSRGNPSLGVTVASTCLDVPVVRTYTNYATTDRLQFATGLTTGALCIHTFAGNKQETEDNGDDQLLTSTIDYYHTPRHHRQASAVAWRPTNARHVAIGLLGVDHRTASSNLPSGALSSNNPSMRRAAAGMRAGGDREFCCFLWDIEGQSGSAASNANNNNNNPANATTNSSKRSVTTAPLTKLSHNAAVASLAWLMDGTSLAVGSQLRNLQIFDLRLSGANAPPVSAFCHNFGVHGIQVDPHRPHMMATFSRAVGETVKLWDIRRMDSVVSEIKISEAGRNYSPEDSIVSAVKWSTLDPGYLAVSVGSAVQEYDTTTGMRPILTHVSHAAEEEPILDFALYEAELHGDHIESSATETSLVSQMYRGRMLTILKNRQIHDVARYTHAPVAVSRRDGRLAYAFGNALVVASTDFGPSAMERRENSSQDDISAIMMRRARCLHVSSYSMDTEANIKLLSNEPVTEHGSHSAAANASLLRLWTWIDRVESLCSESMDQAESKQTPAVWTSKTLLESGVWQLLQMDAPPSSEDSLVVSDFLATPVYNSVARQAALSACGWAGKYALDIVMAECEVLGEYERSAALAVWHGNVGAAVEALQRASAMVRGAATAASNSPVGRKESVEYAEILDLIAICIAGYRGGGEQDAGESSNIWRNACSGLLRREALSVENAGKNYRVVYLRALCEFLISTSGDSGNKLILNNEMLSLSDRVAFACKFLPLKELKDFLLACIVDCQASGNLEGLVITSLTQRGTEILQSYVDGVGDVQTAALVVSRVIIPPEWTAERKICTEWVESYRSLLNTWQMWQSRAMFDVSRAEILRRLRLGDAVPTTSKPGLVPPFAATRRMNSQSGAATAAARRPTYNRQFTSTLNGTDSSLSVPAQLDVRCNYCNASLSLPQDGGRGTTTPNAWLSKSKTVLSSCPTCRKPLPRCAVCSLSLGALNPYTEFATRNNTLSSASTGSSSSLSSMPFAEWFTWCMRCQHGGHAHHLVGWFANHSVCPVSGCHCNCPFDGIQKLARPALNSRNGGTAATTTTRAEF